jgi:ABC-type polysaccharide/polyol phosphate export permease
VASTTTPIPRGRSDDEFFAERHVYEPHKIGLPPLVPYVRELWRRRDFAREMAKTNLQSLHFNTLFGQLWLVLNPLLLSGVYFILVDILRRGAGRPGLFAHLLAGIFAYHLVSDAVRQAVKSVTGGGRLILNTAFPRALLPLAAVMTAFMRFLPAVVVYVPVHLISGLPINRHLLWVFPLVALLVIMASGLSLLVAAGQVYFRDLKNFLPYVLRVWLYASPVLYYASQVPPKYEWILKVNPLGGLLTAWGDVLNLGLPPTRESMLLGCGWAFSIFIVGFLFFVSREREFAVRL